MKKFIDLLGQLEIKVFLLQQRERKNLKISIGKMLFNIEISKEIQLIDIDQRVDQLTSSTDGSQLVFFVEPLSQNQKNE